MWLAGALGAAACGSSSSSSTAECAEPVDAFKELLVVDDAVIDDARSKNANDGPWSFRYVVENLAPETTDPAEFVRAWLMTWSTESTFNGFPLDRTDGSRAQSLQDKVICPWLKATPENQCDDTCGTCSGQKLDLAKAPFRLLAISNRMDLRLNDIDTSPIGEGRLVFGFTEGPADDPASSTIAATAIFEFALPRAKSVQEWAETWHALGKFASYDESYKAALTELTDSFVKRGSSPEKTNGSAIAQVRTNESAFNWMWQLREFGLQPNGMLALQPVFNTPDQSFNQSPTLATWIRDNAEAIKQNRHHVPASMRGASANNLVFSWAAPGIDEPTRRAFASQTCNGCHATENPPVDRAFHISPFQKGVAKVSPFLYDPAHVRKDELTARTESFRAALCGR